VQVKKAMIQSSKKVVALTIAEKINTQQKLKVADLDVLDIMITELNPDEKIFDAYKQKGVGIL
jgi:DeoR/GlpR family transcriptional regulator of sugar metabolism